MRIIGFHNSEEEYGYLSNWYDSDFVWNGIRFTSMEQFMMYRRVFSVSRPPHHFISVSIPISPASKIYY